VDAGENCLVKASYLTFSTRISDRTTVSLEMRKAKCNKIVLEEDPRWKNYKGVRA
jgi:hypothetical protein